MTVNRTTLLDLPLPVTGTESGTWGDTTNNGLTQYLDIAIAGTLVLSTDADVTLTSTEGDSSATNIGATTAQYAILRWTATGSTTRNITALAQSKTYVVINATGGTQSIVLRGAGPTTGVTIISGEKAYCVWNGSDFVKVSSSAAAGGSNTQVQYNNAGVLAGSSNLTFDGTSLTLGGNPTLSAGTANGVVYLNGSKVATSGSALTFDANSYALEVKSASYNYSRFQPPASTQQTAVVLENSGGKCYFGIDNSTGGVFGAGAYGRVFWSDSNYPFMWAINSTERMRLDSSGNLGVGMNPSGTLGTSMKLFVNGASGGGIESFYNNLGGFALVPPSTGAGLIFYTFTGGVGAESYSEQMRLTSTGLGIGTSSPAAKLDVNGAGIVRGFLTTTDAIKLGGNTSAPSSTDAFIYRPADNTLGFGTVSAEKMRLDSSGNLGLGVTPSAWGSAFRANQLPYGSLYSAAYTVLGLSVGAYNDNSNWRYTQSGQLVSRYEQTGGQHQWYTAPSGTAGNAITFTQAMTLDASGNLGIGSTSPVAKLEVSESNGNSIGARIQNTSQTSQYLSLSMAGSAGHGVSGWDNSGIIEAVADAVGSGTRALYLSAYNGPMLFATNGRVERARITSGGDLLVGTTNAAQNAGDGNKFISSGAVWVVNSGSNDGFAYYNSSAAAFRFYVSAAGTISATNTTISAISDQRFKENIRDLDVGLDKIMALKPRKFDWKAGKGKDIKGDRGFIAQEFEQVFPDLIDEWKDPAPEGEEPYKSVRQDLIPVLVKAIQEQQALITSLTARVALLEGN